MKFRFIKTNIPVIQKICLTGLFIALSMVLQKVIAVNYIAAFPFVRLSFGGPALIIFSSIYSLRDYTVVALIVLFLIGGILCALICTKWDFKKTFLSYGKGVLSTLPTIAFILMASSIKYILVEGNVLPTIVHAINDVVSGGNIYAIVFIIFAIVLALEFFISSSTNY